MGRFLCFLFILSGLIACQSTSTSTSKSYPWAETIDSLLQEMSLEEKIGQTALRGTSSRVKGGLPESLKQAVREGRIGAMLNVMQPEYVDELQRIAVEESPQGIPLIFARDVIHGFKTIFPIPLGLAASWDPGFAETCGRISAHEASGVGVRWTFAPMLDIAQDSRWGRIAESPGEDPYLASLLGAAYVRGFQGEDLSDPKRMAACAKHYLGYGAAIGGRDYNTVVLSDPLLQNNNLPPFEAAIDAGAATVMTAFNEINGVPATGNQYLLQDILRDQWAFPGIVVSDWNSVIEMIPHGYAADEREAAKFAAQAGLDLEMTSTAYDNHLLALIESGEITEAQLDELVRHILHVKFELGLFNQPYRPKDHDGDWYAPAHLEAAQRAAIASTVLLENEDVLPMASGTKVALIGPLANAPREQLGTWTFDGEAEPSQTPLAALQAAGHTVKYAPGLAYSRDRSTNGFAAAIQAARQSDVIVFVGGEEAILSGEAHSRANIDLPGAQRELLELLEKTGKPLVLVIMAGRPISFYDQQDLFDAVLMNWHPGTMGGPALEAMLFGKEEPGGRLPVTWPKMAGQSPLFYNHKNTGRPAEPEQFVHIDDIPVGAWQSSLGNDSHYLDAGFTPHYPFGYGLGYAEWEYGEPQLVDSTLQIGDTLRVRLQIRNLTNRPGSEVVQLYTQDVAASLTRPIRELKAFQRVRVEANATVNVALSVPVSQLSFVNGTGERVLEPGTFRVYIGPNAAEGSMLTFTLSTM
ncbi:MAG: glycoside hydrolase family 3 N-terminal domain-containing protein [Bacteroidota bacterium]